MRSARGDYEGPPSKQLVMSRNATGPVWDEKPVATSAALDGAAELNRTFTDSKSLAREILRLQDAHAQPMTIVMRQAEWVQKARAEKLPEPAKPLDAVTATPGQIANAVVWLKAGGYVPRAEIEHDGGMAYLVSIRDAVTRQTSGFDAMLALHPPAEQDDLIRREIARLGARPGPDLRQSLQNARASANGRALVADANEQAHRKYIGLDGRTGTEAQLVFYARTEALEAMYPDTTTGSLAANAPNIASRRPVDVPRMRELGTAGDNLEIGFAHSDATPKVRVR